MQDFSFFSYFIVFIPKFLLLTSFSCYKRLSLYLLSYFPVTFSINDITEILFYYGAMFSIPHRKPRVEWEPMSYLLWHLQYGLLVTVGWGKLYLSFHGSHPILVLGRSASYSIYNYACKSCFHFEIASFGHLDKWPPQNDCRMWLVACVVTWIICRPLNLLGNGNRSEKARNE